MSITAKRRDTEVFSLAFLDCICCGFGAVILVFILTVSQKTDVDKADVDSARDRLRQMQSSVSLTQQELDRVAQILAAAQLELQDINAKSTQDQLKLTDRKNELLLMLQQTGALKDALHTLLGEKKALPTEDVAPPVPIPNIDRRQYLTGVKLQGEFVVFLVRTSGSMLDDTIDAAAARLGDSDDKKREAPKWQRVIQSMEWMLASLDADTHFQILFFGEETTPIIPTRGEEWFSTKDRQTMTEVISRLHKIVPQGGANMERAFTAVRFLPRLPDSIVLITDGLPTRSDSLPIEGDVDEGHRIRFFEIATKQLPPRIPVSTILFPMLTGDPGAPGLYWELANATRGALGQPGEKLARHMIRRRQTQVFSLAFLDCICCGFGAVILIFILSVDAREKEKLQTLVEVNRALAQQVAALAKLKASKEDLEHSNARVATLVTDARLRNDSLHALIDELEKGLQREKRGQEALLVDIDELKKEIAARQKKPDYDMVLKEVKPTPVGLPIGNNYIAFVIDTSGSMRDPNHGGLWPIAIRTIESVLDAYPSIDGIQLLDADGRFVLGRPGTGTAGWMADSPDLRDNIKRRLRRYDQDTVSNPVPGIYNAMRFLFDKENAKMHMGIFVFGDEFASSDTADAVVRRLDELNPADENGVRRVTINAVGFPTTIRYQFSMGNTGLRFANLMRTICYMHGGCFIALQDL